MASPNIEPRQSILTSRTAAEAARDRTEDQLNELFSRAMRKFLARAEREIKIRLRAGTTVLTAAGDPPPDPLTLGIFARMWGEIVDQQVMDDILTAWQRVYGTGTTMIADSAVRAAVEEYLPRVRDRLVRGEVWIGGKRAPSVAEDSFDKARVILSRSAAEGWTRQRTAQRIATEFGWETNGSALREELNQINGEIEQILNPLGHPGTPAREYARLHDPIIAELQAQGSEITKQLDAEQSYWQNRAQLIARTESTSLHGYSANNALAAEGFSHKQWMATHDTRTRDSHREADGQTVPVDAEFIVGGFAMQFPGDPSAPVGEIANCRCTMIGADREDDQDQEGPQTQAGNSGGGAGGGLPPLRGMGEPPDENDKPAWNAYWKARQDALEGKGFTSNGAILKAHEVQFLERFLDAGEQASWIPLDPKRRPTNDFYWVEQQQEFEIKATGATYKQIHGRIVSAASQAFTRHQMTKNRFIIDLSDQELTDALRDELAGFNIGRRKYRLASLWVMTRGQLVEIALKQ